MIIIIYFYNYYIFLFPFFFTKDLTDLGLKESKSKFRDLYPDQRIFYLGYLPASACWFRH